MSENLEQNQKFTRNSPKWPKMVPKSSNWPAKWKFSKKCNFSKTSENLEEKNTRKFIKMSQKDPKNVQIDPQNVNFEKKNSKTSKNLEKNWPEDSR